MPLWSCGIVLLICASVSYGEICECKSPPHPQDWFCQASFALRGKLAGRVHEEEGGLMSATVSVTQVFKGLNQLLQSESAEYFGQMLYQIKIFFTSKCPVHLKKGTQYLLTGIITVSGEVYTGKCAWHSPWSQLTVTHVKGLRTTYKRNCGCKVDCGKWWVPRCRQCGRNDLEGRPIVKACAWDHMYCGLSDDWDKCEWKSMTDGYEKCTSETIGGREVGEWERKENEIDQQEADTRLEAANVLAALIDN